MNVTPDTPQKLHATVLDTSVVQIAHVYAAALYNAAENGKQLDSVIEEYESFVNDVLAKNPNFDQTLQSTIIGRADKGATIRRVFEKRASQTFLNFLLVLNDHGRLVLLRPVLAEVKAIRDQRLGRIPVQVQTAVPLGSAE